MAARAARYKDCGPPACTAVQVAGLFIPGAMIEIQATAVID
jgi:enamine deaminase RidA (YjgF/YER057c/UK114 family)